MRQWLSSIQPRRLAVLGAALVGLLLAGWWNAQRLRAAAREEQQALARGGDAESAGDPQSAAREFRRAAELAPRDPAPWYRLGIALGELHHYPESREVLLRALRRD